MVSNKQGDDELGNASQDILLTLKNSAGMTSTVKVKYLGGSLDSTMRWHLQDEQLCARLGSSIYLLQVFSTLYPQP